MKILMDLVLRLILIAAVLAGATVVVADDGDEVHQAYITPHQLIHAAYHRDIEEVKRRLAAGDDPNMADHIGATALVWVADKGYPEIAKVLLDGGADVDRADNHGATALMSATSQGRSEVAKVLLGADANPNVKDNDGWTALMRTAVAGRPKIARMLLDAGANLKAVDDTGRTALDMAVQEGDAHMLLVFQVAYNALFLSVVTDYLSGVQKLLDDGANINQTDAAGWTALMFAAKVGGANMTRLLIKLGADVNVANADGWTALDIALDVGDRGVARILRKAGAEE